MGYLMYALVTNNELTVRQPGALETKLSDGALIGAPDGIWTDELAALCGFIRVTETPRPDDTGTTTWDRTIELVDGTPTVVWTERDKTPEELAPPQPSTEERLAQLQATIGVMTETLAQISPEKLAAVTARLDKLAPVRSEHDVPADPTYLPPATDLRTPR